jgi:hypothetical protein
MWRRGGDIHRALSPGGLGQRLAPDFGLALREADFCLGEEWRAAHS